MAETIHLSSSSTSTAISPFNATKCVSLSRPRYSRYPTLSSPTPPSLTLPPIPNQPSNSTGSILDAPPPLPPSSQLLQEKLLYLDSLGLDSLYCLTAHPPILSVKLSQIKSTVEYLHSIDLSTPDICRAFSMCPEILATPLRGVIRPAVTFLLREARVWIRDLRHVIYRRPRLLTCSVERQLRPTLYFLQATIGIEDVSRCAPLLSCSVESKFIPRLDYFLKLGLPKREAISLFRRFPSLFCYSVEQNLEPKFNYFVMEMGRDLRELVDFPHYFSFSLDNRIKPRHKLCMERGVYLPLPVMLKTSEGRFRKRLEVCCNSSIPVRTSPLWCNNVHPNLT